VPKTRGGGRVRHMHPAPTDPTVRRTSTIRYRSATASASTIAQYPLRREIAGERGDEPSRDPGGRRSRRSGSQSSGNARRGERGREAQRRWPP